nr:hypothetical protein [Tanacetum cinerariifolium]
MVSGLLVYELPSISLRKKYRLNLKNDIPPQDKMDDLKITMEEYIRIEEEKAQKHGKVFKWVTAKYGKIWYDKDVYDIRSVETEFPAIVFNNNLTSNETLSCEPTISSLNNNEIDFRISFDESDDEDYTIIFDKNSFSYKIIYAHDLKTNSENDNEKVNMPLFLSPEPLVSYFSTEPTLCPQHIDELDLKDETPLSEYDEVEQNVLYFKDLIPFNIIYPDDIKSDKDNDDNEIDMIQSSRGNENTQGLNNLLKASHDKINKVFIMKSFVMELNVNIVAWNYFVNENLFNIIKNLYVPFGISFEPKRYYKDGDCTRMLRRPRNAKGRKSDARLSGGHFIGRLAHHFGMVSDDGLRGLSLVTREMPLIDMGELVKLNMYIEIGVDWAWVASRPERQPDATVGALRAVKDAPTVDEDAQADPAPLQAP